METKLTPKEYLLNRLEMLKLHCNEDGWDGYNAYPLEFASIENTKVIIELTSDEVLSNFILFPSPNGTLSLDLRDNIGAMSIGNSNFSYAAIKIGYKSIKGKQDMDYQLASEKLSEMVDYFKSESGIHDVPFERTWCDYLTKCPYIPGKEVGSYDCVEECLYCYNSTEETKSFETGECQNYHEVIHGNVRCGYVPKKETEN